LKKLISEKMEDPLPANSQPQSQPAQEAVPDHTQFTDKENLKFLADKFEDAQQSFAAHSTHTRAILQRFNTDWNALFKYLTRFIQLVLAQPKITDPGSRCIKFIVKIATSVTNGKEFADKLADAILRFALKYWNSKKKIVRLKICNFTGTLLNELDEDQDIDEDLWEMLETRILLRLKDKCPQIRKSAVAALNRLQNPDMGGECPVIRGLVQLMDHDRSKDVRHEALQRIDMNGGTVEEMYRRIRDYAPTVRVEVFDRFCKVDITGFKIKDRVGAMKDGLMDRQPKVKQACSNLIINNWFKSVDGDILKFIELMGPEHYEKEAELVVKHILMQGADIDTTQPPYPHHELDINKALYWRVLLDVCHESTDLDADFTEKFQPTLSQFAEILKHLKEDEFISWQLLKMAERLEFGDEYGRDNLHRELVAMLKDMKVSNEIIPFAGKILRKCIDDENELIRVIIEDVVNEIRDPIEEQDSEEVEKRKKVIAEELDTLYAKRVEVQKQMMQAAQLEAFAEAGERKKELEKIKRLIEHHNHALTELQRGDQETWRRVLAIVADLLEFTRQPITHPFLEPLLESTLMPAIGHVDPDIRESGLLAFGLYCLLDKNTTRKYIRLFTDVLKHDQLALKYLALKIVFDIFLVFDFRKPKSPIPEDDGGPTQDDYDPDVKDLIDVMKSYLGHPDQDLLACAVEGFCKLLFLNRLSHLHNEVLPHLILLFFNGLTEENEQIRQTLALFFPAYVQLENPDAKYSARQSVAKCIMPCLRAVAYSPDLSDLSITNVAEFLLSLLTADPRAPNQLSNPVQPTDPNSVHEDVAFDILFEIEANLETEGDKVLPMCKVLGILTVDANQEHNAKQYKVLLDRIMSKVTKKSALMHLKKFKETLKHADKKPDEELSPDKLLKLEERRKGAVESATAEIRGFMQKVEASIAPEEIPRPPSRPRKRKLQGRRQPMENKEKKRKRRKVEKREAGEGSAAESQAENQADPGPADEESVDPAQPEPKKARTSRPSSRNSKTSRPSSRNSKKAKPKRKTKAPKKSRKTSKKKRAPKKPKKPAARDEESEEDEIDRLVAQSNVSKANDAALQALASSDEE